MLQPLWESRDRYEELKQMDDAVREVSRLCEGLGSTGPTPLGHTTQGASSGAHLSHIDARPDAEVFCPQGAHSMGDTEPWEESVVVHGGSASATCVPSERVSGPHAVPPLLPGPTLFRSKAMEETPCLWKSHHHTQPWTLLAP